MKWLHRKPRASLVISVSEEWQFASTGREAFVHARFAEWLYTLERAGGTEQDAMLPFGFSPNTGTENDL